jgi:hypothetical protein
MQAIGDFFKNDRFTQHNAIELLEIAAGRAQAKMAVTDDTGEIVALFEGMVYRKKDPIGQPTRQ